MARIQVSKSALNRLRAVAKFGNQSLSECILYYIPEEREEEYNELKKKEGGA